MYPNSSSKNPRISNLNSEVLSHLCFTGLPSMFDRKDREFNFDHCIFRNIYMSCVAAIMGINFIYLFAYYVTCSV